MRAQLHLAIFIVWIVAVQSDKHDDKQAKIHHRYGYSKKVDSPVKQGDHGGHDAAFSHDNHHSDRKVHHSQTVHDHVGKSGHAGKSGHVGTATHAYEPWRAWQEELMERKKDDNENSWIKESPQKHGYHYQVNHKDHDSKHDHPKPKTHSQEHDEDHKRHHHVHSSHKSDHYDKHKPHNHPHSGHNGQHPYYHSHKYIPNAHIKHETKTKDDYRYGSHDYDGFNDYEDSEEDTKKHDHYEHHEKDTKKEHDHHHHHEKDHTHGDKHGGHSQSWFYRPVQGEHDEKDHKDEHHHHHKQVHGHIKVTDHHHKTKYPKHEVGGSFHYKHHKNEDAYEHEPNQDIHEDKYHHHHHQGSYHKHKSIPHHKHVKESSYGREHHDEDNKLDWKSDLMKQKEELMHKHFKSHKKDQDDYHKGYYHQVHNMPWYGKYRHKKYRRPHFNALRIHRPWFRRPRKKSHKKSKRVHNRLPKHYVPWHAGYGGYKYGKPHGHQTEQAHYNTHQGYSKSHKVHKSNAWHPTTTHRYQGYYGYGSYKPWKKPEKHQSHKPKKAETKKTRGRKGHKTHKGGHHDYHGHSGHSGHSPHPDEHKKW